MGTDFRIYCKEWETEKRWCAFTLALTARIPKKYAEQIIRLLRHFPEAMDTHIVETTTGYLGLIWQCAPEEAVRDLQRMTVRSHGTMTYRLGERQMCLGVTVQIQFAVEVTKGQTNG